ncbi:hypothetical protein [Planktothricoides raciborskii]|uniref:Uncharacterized protein n=1 Tax=Planktothricoides raciborskii GIHE-MW2 TaxID=2792601 RepID=A0AAU8JHR4_9CYAN
MNSEKKPGFSCPQDAIAQPRNRVSHVSCPNFWLIPRRNPVSHAPRKARSLNQETGFLIFSAQIFGEFREETRFLISQDAIAPSNFHNQTRNRVSGVFSPNFWLITRRNPVSHVPRCDRPKDLLLKW